jgi:NAD(P)-dependent dehydrogenase (short-subunit alcohol dehydrogenase family)
VNTISPGHIDTPIFDTWQQGDALMKMKEDLARDVPLGRLGDPDEIAKVVSFLAPDGRTEALWVRPRADSHG